MNTKGIVGFYIKKEHEATWEILKKILKREGKPIGQWVIENAVEYISVHRDGNPQTQLDYASNPKTLPFWKTCRWSKGKLHNGEFACTSEGMQYLKTPMNCENQNRILVKKRGWGCYESSKQ